MLTQSVGFGIRLPNSGPFALGENILATAEKAAQLGYDSVWVHDHIAWTSEKRTHFAAGSLEAWTDQKPNFFESMSTLAFIAGRIPQIDIGVAGLVLPLRDPRLLAKQVATVQALAGDRLILGYAIGGSPKDFEVVDVPFKRRGRMTDEYLCALEEIFMSPVSAFEGKFVRFSNAEFYPHPNRVRAWICGWSDPACRRIADHADGWLPVYLSVSEYREKLRRVSEILEEKGRTLNDITRGLELFVTVADTREKAIAIAERSLIGKFETLERGLDVSLVGTPEQISEQMNEFVAVGVSYFELKFISHTFEQMLEMMKRISGDVIPGFRVSGIKRSNSR